MSKVWLITGASRGLGRSLAEAVLAHGDRVCLTARDPSTVQDLIERYPATARSHALDVTDEAQSIGAVTEAVRAFGRLDVLVNNAGYGLMAPFEFQSGGDFRAQVETNFFGVINLTRAALPVMRGQRSGRIFNVSSVGGRMGTPGMTAYQSAKWAVGGFTEALSQEVRGLGIHVVALEPGGMRTEWAATARGNPPAIDPDYAPSVGAMLDLLSNYSGKENSDPARVAQVILDLADHPNPPLHLLLGSDAVHFSGEVEKKRAADGETWREVSISTDVGNVALPSLPGLHA